MEQLVYQLVLDRPENPVVYMIDYLQKLGGYTSNGITIDEKKELERLRVEIRKYRDMQEHDNKEQHDHSFTDDEDDDIDDHIDKKVIHAQARLSRQREAVSAEVYGQFNQKENFVPKYVAKNDDQIQRIKARVLQSFLFAALESKDLGIVIGCMEEKHYKAGQNVITQGESGDCLYIVETGELNCFKTFTKGGEDKLVKTYGSGDSFGELALLYNAPRAATVKASSSCILWTVDRETFNHIVKEAAQNKRQQYENFLKSVEILSTVEPYELSQIADALKSCNYNVNDYVIREGELGDVFYILVDGEAVATKTMEPGKAPVEVKKYSKGSYFGELALLKGEPRAANVVAVTPLRLISLDRNSFKRLLGPIDDILKRNSEQYVKYVQN
eukprot:CAMPEP_0170518338 /NCGR_PEP_ID=MMETSP0209-20121228/4048_1 /TAXON_ID=665100 ORGANISM="Litonotus pictus, Strain P1" /NCGR_SAMPLE_ID=MMETSP0209 /ASSEMBLY_ACC=CAM_ASM_000301 /LENGTH=385 /DNA_ID=CAMNT_0010803861 /DNA_START=51 /DNA_END=1208 /DNA_ORIENTATION=+